MSALWKRGLGMSKQNWWMKASIGLEAPLLFLSISFILMFIALSLSVSMANAAGNLYITDVYLPPSLNTGDAYISVSFYNDGYSGVPVTVTAWDNVYSFDSKTITSSTPGINTISLKWGGTKTLGEHKILVSVGLMAGETNTSDNSRGITTFVSDYGRTLAVNSIPIKYNILYDYDIQNEANLKLERPVVHSIRSVNRETVSFLSDYKNYLDFAKVIITLDDLKQPFELVDAAVKLKLAEMGLAVIVPPITYKEIGLALLCIVAPIADYNYQLWDESFKNMGEHKYLDGNAHILLAYNLERRDENNIVYATPHWFYLNSSDMWIEFKSLPEVPFGIGLNDKFNETITGYVSNITTTISSITITDSYYGDRDEDGFAKLYHKTVGSTGWIDDGVMLRGSNNYTKTILNLTPNSAYDIKINYSDPDEVNGTNPIQNTSIRTSSSSDALRTIVDVISENYTCNSITIEGMYFGDSDSDGSATLYYKRTASNSWTNAGLMAKSADRYTKTISGLSENTNYDVQISFADPDGIMGTNPIQKNSINTGLCGSGYPPTPVLYDPGTINSDGNYQVKWSYLASATYYELEESGANSQIYNSSAPVQYFSGKGNGIYYYRARSCNKLGCSPWSNTENLEVLITASPLENSYSGYVYTGSALNPKDTGVTHTLGNWKIEVINRLNYDITGSQSAVAKVFLGSNQRSSRTIPFHGTTYSTYSDEFVDEALQLSLNNAGRCHIGADLYYCEEIIMATRTSSVYATPSSLTMAPGENKTFSLTITKPYSIDEYYFYSPDSSKNWVTKKSGTNFEVSVLPNASNGTYLLTIMIISGRETFSVMDYKINVIKPNQAPNQPMNPSPATGANSQAIDLTLSWIGGDPDGDAVTYTVFLDSGENPATQRCQTSYTSCMVSGLEYNTQYNWKVVADDTISAPVSSTIWTFITKNSPNNAPYQPSNPYPASNDVNQSSNLTLIWKGGDPDGNTLTYTIYLDKNANPTTNIYQGTYESYSLMNLSPNTTYYWKVTTFDGSLSDSGPVWQFTTSTASESTAPAPNVIFEDDFESYDAGNYPASPWYNIFSGAYGTVSTENAYSGTKSFKTQGNYGWSRSDAIPLSPITKIGYEVSIYPMGQDAMLTLNNRNIGSWGSHDANINFATDGHVYGGGIDLGTYNMNQWYKVRVNADFDSQKMDIYVDGIYKGTGTVVGEYPLAPGEVRYNSLALESRWFSDPGIYYDDVKVFDLTNETSIDLSNSGGGTWQHSKNLAITNLGDALTHYQVLVNLTGNSFPIEANTSGADIRFTDANNSELAYWIENWDFTNRSGQVWVNVTNVPSGVSSLRMWYGNPNATSSSNGDTTFEFFDDFEGDLDKWSKSGLFGIGAPNVSNKYLEFWSDSKEYTHMWSDWNNSLKYFEARFEAKLPLQSVEGNFHINFISNKSSNDDIGCNAGEYYYRLRFYGSTYPSMYDDNFDKCIDGQLTHSIIHFGYNTIPDWKEIKIIVNESGVFVKIGSDFYSASDTSFETFDRIYLMGCDTNHKYFDDLYIRKYTSAEPYIAGYINGTVQNNSTGIAEAIVTTNTNISTKTNASGFYSMLLPLGEYHLTAVSEPRFYVNNSVIVNAVAGYETIQDIELLKKQTGNITGSALAK